MNEPIKCNECGKFFDKNFGVCPFCGNALEKRKVRINKSQIILAAVSVFTIVVICILVVFFRNKNDFHIPNATFTSNCYNYSMAVKYNDSIYYSQPRDGIYICNESGKDKKILDGNYTDLIIRDRAIYAIKSSNNERTYNLVKINLDNLTTSNIYTLSENDENIALGLWVNDKIENEIYYTSSFEATDSVYVLDEDDNFKMLGNYSNIVFYDEGFFYTKNNCIYFMNSKTNTEETFYKYSKNDHVNAFFIINDALYVNISKQAVNGYEIRKIDIQTAKLSDRYIQTDNYYFATNGEKIFYYTINEDTLDASIYESDLNFEKKKLIHEFNIRDFDYLLGFNTLYVPNEKNDYLYVCVALDENSGFFINLEDQ